LTELLTGASAAPLAHVVMSQRVVEDLFTRSASGRSASGAAGPGQAGGAGWDPWPIRFDDIDGRCELINGVPLHPHFAAGVAGIARFRRLVFSPEGEILDHGRMTRTFPSQLKQALLVKARGHCQHPGCDAPLGWLEADHLMPWNRAGPTSASNGQVLCGRHNKLKGDGLPGASPGAPPPGRDDRPERSD
jgi:hypothetical protein